MNRRDVVAYSVAVLAAIGLCAVILNFGSVMVDPSPPDVRLTLSNDTDQALVFSWTGAETSDNVGMTVPARDGLFVEVGVVRPPLHIMAKRMDGQIVFDREYRAEDLSTGSVGVIVDSLQTPTPKG